MKLFIFKFLFLFFLSFLFTNLPVQAFETEKFFDSRIGKYVDVVKGQVIVKFKSNVDSTKINSFAVGGFKISALDESGKTYIYDANSFGKKVQSASSGC